jgi:cytochrome c oxidase cbb3-type subunit 3
VKPTHPWEGRAARRWIGPTLIGLTALLVLMSACKREERGFRVSPPAIARRDGTRLSPLEPGGKTPRQAVKNSYEDNAYALNEGKVLFNAFNCVGCHAHGGGGMGPPLMDAKWRYGSDSDQIFSTIMEGRPNGMPAFRGKLSEDAAWKIVGYVRSLSGLVPQDAAPSRDDHMKTSPPGNSVEPVTPTAEKAP